MISIAVVDDDAYRRAGLVLAVRAGAEPVAVVEPGAADAVLLSTDDPSAAVGMIRAQVAPVVVLSSAEDSAIAAALRAGARGYVVKGAADAELRLAVRLVAEGGCAFCATASGRIVEFFQAAKSLPGFPELPDLTGREREILEFIAHGRDNRYIARRLVLSEKTVRNHVTRLFRKLHVSDRAAAASVAELAGLRAGESCYRPRGATRPVS